MQNDSLKVQGILNQIAGFTHDGKTRVGVPAVFGMNFQAVSVGQKLAKDNKAATVKRLNRVEGQVRGLARMVEGDRYCIDIVTQIGAVRAALRRVEEEILRDHVAHCVDHAIKSGNKADQRRKVAELMDVMGRAAR